MPPPWKSFSQSSAPAAAPVAVAPAAAPSEIKQEKVEKSEPAPSPWTKKLQNGGSSSEHANSEQAAPSPWAQKLQNGGPASGNSNSTSNGGSSSFNKFGSSNNAKSSQIKIMFWSSNGSEDDLRNLFSGVGEIKRARVLPPREGRDITLSFLTFSSESEAESAVEQFNNYEYEGRRLRVQIDDNAGGKGSAPSGSTFASQGFGAQASSAKGNKVKVLSCPATLSEDDVKTLFSEAGEVQNVRVLQPREGRDITLAFVTFMSDESAEAAVKQFNNFEVEGKSLRVQIDDNAGGRGGSSSGSTFASQGFGTTASSSQGFSGWGPSDQGSGAQTSAAKGNKVKVLSWPATLSEDHVNSLFSGAGEVQNVRVLQAREGRDVTLAFVTFVSDESAEAAVKQFDNYRIEGKSLRVQIDDNAGGRGGGGSNSNSSDAKGNQVKVLSCPASASEDDLKSIFSAAGEVKNVRILPPRDGRDTTLGFVTYSNDNEAAAAVQQFNNHELDGKTLRVSINDRGQKQNDSKPTGWFSTGNEGTTNGWGSSAPSSDGGAKPWGSSAPSSDGGAKPWGSSAPTSDGGAKPWGAPKSDSASTGTPWGSASNGDSGNNSGERKPGGFSKSYGAPNEERPQRSGGGNDGGIFIDAQDMKEDFSLQGQMSGRAPVTYVPPPPPEEEAEIFDHTCHQGINFEKYENIPVEITGSNLPRKITSFQEADLHEICKHNIRRAKYDKPTPVQKHTLPVILAKRDVMACAQTGSGKTAAYLLPLISDILKSGTGGCEPGEIASPNALIIVPTRELAIQIFLEARKFAYGSPLRTVVIYGGVSVSHQLGMLYDGCNILVATPGRLGDFMGRGRVSMSNIRYLVLDEADRMLDMGFGPAMQKIIEADDMTPKGQRQTLMLSATFPESIQTLAGNYLNDYVFITVGRVGGASSDIVQNVLEIQGSEKRAKLEEILIQSGSDRTLVFVETKRSADFLASFLSQRNFPTQSISSDRTQEEREFALRDFRSGKAPVLIATAVAARGLDIPDVKHVVNFDLPSEIDEYVHRIGRTGRIGNKGRATAFFDRTKDMKIARGLIKVLAESSQDVPDWLEEIANSAIGTGYGPAGGNFSSRDKRQNHNGGQRFARGSASSDTQAPQQQVTPPAAANGASDNMWC